MGVSYLSFLPMREAALIQGFNQIISAKCMASSSLIDQFSFGMCLFKSFYLFSFFEISHMCFSLHEF